MPALRQRQLADWHKCLSCVARARGGQVTALEMFGNEVYRGRFDRQGTAEVLEVQNACQAFLSEPKRRRHWLARGSVVESTNTLACKDFGAFQKAYPRVSMGVRPTRGLRLKIRPVNSEPFEVSSRAAPLQNFYARPGGPSRCDLRRHWIAMRSACRCRLIKCTYVPKDWL